MRDETNLQLRSRGHPDWHGAVARRRRRAEPRTTHKAPHGRPARAPHRFSPCVSTPASVGPTGVVMGASTTRPHPRRHTPGPARAASAPFPAPSRHADERTRTSTRLPGHGPEPCASTNSATSAWGQRRYRTGRRGRACGLGRGLRPAAKSMAGGDGASPSAGWLPVAASASVDPRPKRAAIV